MHQLFANRYPVYEPSSEQLVQSTHEWWETSKIPREFWRGEDEEEKSSLASTECKIE